MRDDAARFFIVLLILSNIMTWAVFFTVATTWAVRVECSNTYDPTMCEVNRD